jgi:outer membrane beta-barrel protein
MSLPAAPARATDLEEGGALYAVQNRKYTENHELHLGVGTVPLDAFYKGFTGTASYTWHFDDLWAWEVVSASYSLNVATSLREELERNWGVKPTEFPELQWFGDSNLVLKPLYGKLAWFNDSLVYGELFFTAGPALARYENAGTFVGGNVGMGLRFYLSETVSWRIDARDYFVVLPSDPGDNHNELFFSTGFSLNVR